MDRQRILSHDILSQLYSYDGETGEITYKDRPLWTFLGLRISPEKQKKRWAGRIAIGAPAFRIVTSHGYFSGTVSVKDVSVRVYAHQVAWALSEGKWPSDEIDHINHNGFDNRRVNLRLADRYENSRNMPLTSRNRSGRIGITTCKQTGKWSARIGHEGKNVFLGRFDDFAAAVAAREAAERSFGFHPNHGG